MARVTGARARSTLPPCDTPGVAIPTPGGPDSLSRAAAEAAWHAVTSSIAGTQHVRISRDGGRTYPARHARPLPAEPPGQPCTVPVFDPAMGTGRMLALDLDPTPVGRDVDDAAVGHRHERGAVPEAAVCAQAEALAGLVAGCGGRVLADVSPSGGRHVFVVFAAALPWLELRDVARALALRFPSIDTSPMSSLGGQISPPGSRHKSGGWRLLSVSLEDAATVAANPNGPEVWAELLEELAAELRRIELGPACTTLADEAEMDDTGVPWLPRLGGRAPLGADLERVARSGRSDRSRYPGRSEARMAVLNAAAARGWQLAEVRAAVASGAWKGLAGLYERRSEPGRMDRLLPLEWRKTIAFVSGEENVRGWHTSDVRPRPPAGESASSAEYGHVRTWQTAIHCAAEEPERVKGWGGRAIAVRLVLLALGQAAMVSGSSTIEFGTRNLALYSALSHRTVSRVLRLLRDEPDPLVDLVSPRRMARADRYALRIPDRYADSARWRRLDLARGDRGQCAGGRQPQRVHGFAHQVLAQHRTDRGAPVPASRIGSAARALELDVAPAAGRVQRLAQKNGPAVAELRDELPELMPGVGHRDRLRLRQQPVAREDLGQLGRTRMAGLESEIRRELCVEFDEAWAGNARRIDARVEMRRKAGISAGGKHVPMVTAIHRESPPARRRHGPMGGRHVATSALESTGIHP